MPVSYVGKQPGDMIRLSCTTWDNGKSVTVEFDFPLIQRKTPNGGKHHLVSKPTEARPGQTTVDKSVDGFSKVAERFKWR